MKITTNNKFFFWNPLNWLTYQVPSSLTRKKKLSDLLTWNTLKHFCDVKNRFIFFRISYILQICFFYHLFHGMKMIFFLYKGRPYLEEKVRFILNIYSKKYIYNMKILNWKFIWQNRLKSKTIILASYTLNSNFAQFGKFSFQMAFCWNYFYLFWSLNTPQKPIFL